MGGGAGAPGRASQGQAGLGRVGSRRGSKSHDTHNHWSESKRETKTKTRLYKHAIEHDIKQSNMPRHDATPMTT
jgi:hypothetical protein